MKKMRLLVFILVGVLLVVAPLLGACGEEPEEPGPSEPGPSEPGPSEPEEPEEPEVIELTYATMLPPTHMTSLGTIDWMAKIEEETNGRVHITPYWGGTLVNPRESVTDMLHGVADIGFIFPQYGAGGFDVHASIAVGYYLSPGMEASWHAYVALCEQFPELVAEFADFKTMGYIAGGTEQLHSIAPVRTLDDFAGLTLKATDNFIAVLGKLGGEAVSIPMSEAFTSLEKSLIGGVHTFCEGLKSENLAEVCPYSTLYNVGRETYPGQVMNMDTWNSLPADIQQVFEDNVDWYTQRTIDYSLVCEQEGIDFANTMDHEWIEFSAEDQAAFYALFEEVIAEKAAELDANGYSGTEIFAELKRLLEEAS
jgi:TRAP-type C4-dicarboxylate transport system substrate-binding protein